MGGLFKLPREILQHIGSFLKVSDKHAFLESSKLAEQAYDNDQVEHSELWDLVFKEKTWPDAKHADGIPIGLMGNLRTIMKASKGGHLPDHEKPNITLVLSTKRLGRYVRQVATQSVWLTATLPPLFEEVFHHRNYLTRPTVVRDSTNRHNMRYGIETYNVRDGLAASAIA